MNSDCYIYSDKASWSEFADRASDFGFFRDFLGIFHWLQTGPPEWHPHKMPVNLGHGTFDRRGRELRLEARPLLVLVQGPQRSEFPGVALGQVQGETTRGASSPKQGFGTYSAPCKIFNFISRFSD